MGKKKSNKLSLGKRDVSDYEDQKPNKKDLNGKPPNTKDQTQFMNKYKNGKMQQITAESFVEIMCHKFEDTYPMQYAGRTLKGQQDTFAKEKLASIKKWFIEKNQARFEPLWNSYTEAIKQWRYKDFQKNKENQNSEQFLFKDEADLTYLLWFGLSNGVESIKKKTGYLNDQLFFYELLSLATQDQLSFRLIDALKQHHEEIVNSMEGLKEKMIEKQITNENQENQGNEQKKEEQSEMSAKKETEHKLSKILNKHKDLSDHLRKGCLWIHVPSENEVEQINKRIEGFKTKQIHKEEPGEEPIIRARKRGRPKKQASQKIEEPPIEVEELTELVEAMLSHIAWAYKYIYPYELQKIQLLETPSQ